MHFLKLLSSNLFFNIIRIVLNRRNILISLVLVGIILIPLSYNFNHNSLDLSEWLLDFVFQILFLTHKNSNLKQIVKKTFKYALLSISLFFYIEIISFLSKLYVMELNLPISIILFFGMVFNRTLKLLIIKRNKNFKLYYFKNVLNFRKFKQQFNLYIKFTLEFLKNYPLVVLGFLQIVSYYTQSYLLLFIYSVRLFFVSLWNLDYFKELKVTRENDIKSFNFHWSVDSDLKILDKLLVYSKILGVLIFLFSYYFNIDNLGSLGNQYQLFSFSYFINFKEIQYFLGINLVGPIMLLLGIVVRLILNLHVIYFRNPWTVLKGVATIVTSTEAAMAIGILSSAAAGSVELNSQYHSGPGPQNIVKNAWDYHVEGAVRHTVESDLQFLLLKKKGVNIPTSSITEYQTKLFTIEKVKAVLSVPGGQFTSELDKLSPSELHALKCTDLIKEKDLLRYNLEVCQGIGAKTLTSQDYIYQYSKIEKYNFSVLGMNPPSEGDLHDKYKKLTMEICKTNKGQADLDQFLLGTSDRIFFDLKAGREFGTTPPPIINLELLKRDLARFIKEDRFWVLKSSGIGVRKPLLLGLLLENLEVKEEPFNAGKYLEAKINKKLPLLLKNVPENP